jgi:hypothetical protein
MTVNGPVATTSRERRPGLWKIRGMADKWPDNPAILRCSRFLRAGAVIDSNPVVPATFRPYGLRMARPLRIANYVRFRWQELRPQTNSKAKLLASPNSDFLVTWLNTTQLPEGY